MNIYNSNDNNILIMVIQNEKKKENQFLKFKFI